jgi:hypothetical protein
MSIEKIDIIGQIVVNKFLIKTIRSVGESVGLQKQGIIYFFVYNEA